MKSIVVAIGANNEIGAGGDLPWQRDLPSDLAHFKKITSGGSVIMGRKTFESLKRPLPNRQNIVISHSYLQDGTTGIEVARSLKEAYAKAAHGIFIIGGSAVFQEAFQSADRIYLTQVKQSFPNADTFLTGLNLVDWHQISKEFQSSNTNDKYDMDFLILERA